MDWSQIQSLYDGQGLVFWAAVASVALGLTMLSVAIVFQLGKVLRTAKRNRAERRTKNMSRQRETAVRKLVKATTDGYEPGGFVPARVEPPVAAENIDPLLSSLLTRLKSSADRLERMHLSLGSDSAVSVDTPESPLKDVVEDVDYVYQAARA